MLRFFGNKSAVEFFLQKTSFNHIIAELVHISRFCAWALSWLRLYQGPPIKYWHVNSVKLIYFIQKFSTLHKLLFLCSFLPLFTVPIFFFQCRFLFQFQSSLTSSSQWCFAPPLKKKSNYSSLNNFVQKTHLLECFLFFLVNRILCTQCINQFSMC